MTRAALSIAMLICTSLFAACTPSTSEPGDAQTTAASAIAATPSPDDVSEASSAQAPTSFVAAEATTIPTAPAAGSPLPPADARPARVTHVNDGDSFEITWLDVTDAEADDEVRLVGINAPEWGDCFSNEARDALRSLVTGQEILVNVVGRDGFDDFRGRALADVWVGTDWVNGLLVSGGSVFAQASVEANGPSLMQAQAAARAASVGLWSPDACAIAASGVAIDWVESDPRGRDADNLHLEWVRIRNIGADPVDLTGWALRDESTRNRYHFPDAFLLAPSAEVRVRTGAGADSASDLYWGAEFPVWNNAGDTAYLLAADGRIAAWRSYLD